MRDNHHDEIWEGLKRAADRYIYEMALDRASITVFQTPNDYQPTPSKEPTDGE